MNRAGSCDVALEPHEVGMGNDTVSNVDSEVVGGIACAALRGEDEVP
jgi:hypothetical protein